MLTPSARRSRASALEGPRHLTPCVCGPPPPLRQPRQKAAGWRLRSGGEQGQQKESSLLPLTQLWPGSDSVTQSTWLEVRVHVPQSSHQHSCVLPKQGLAGPGLESCSGSLRNFTTAATGRGHSAGMGTSSDTLTNLPKVTRSKPALAAAPAQTGSATTMAADILSPTRTPSRLSPTMT